MLALSGKGLVAAGQTLPKPTGTMSLRWFKANGLIDPEAVYLALQNACR